MSNQPDEGWLDRRAAEGMLELANRDLKDGVGKLPPVRGFLGAIDYIRTREGIEDWLTLLDVGCGIGMYSEVISLFCPKIDYMGCDVSPHMVEIANERFPNDVFIVADALEPLPYWWDIVLASSLVEVIGPSWRKALANLLAADTTWLILNRVRVWNDDAHPTEIKEYETIYGTTAWDVIHNWPELIAAIRELGSKIAWARAYQVEPETSLMCYVVEVNND